MSEHFVALVCAPMEYVPCDLVQVSIRLTSTLFTYHAFVAHLKETLPATMAEEHMILFFVVLHCMSHGAYGMGSSHICVVKLELYCMTTDRCSHKH